MGRRRERLESGRWRVVVAAPHQPAVEDPIEAMITRARKLRGRGDDRKALLLLRQACMLDEWRARSWTLLGVMLARASRGEEALRALNHARWLRARAGEQARATVTARLIQDLALAA